MAKFSELQIGQEWALGNNRVDFDHTAIKVIIADTQKYSRSSKWADFKPAVKGGFAGTHVKVRKPSHWDAETNGLVYRDSYVMASHLLMTWTEHEERLAKYKARKERDEAIAEKHKQHHADVIVPKARKIAEHFKAKGGYLSGWDLERWDEKNLDILIALIEKDV